MAKRTHKSAEMPISTLIDVVFLLLIYFIVTQKEIIPEAHLAVNLPAPSGAPDEAEMAKPLEVAIYPNKRIIFGMVGSGGGVVTIEKLHEKLEKLAQSEKNRAAMVFVKIHVRAEVDTLVKVLDCFQGLGLTNLNLTPFEE
jgi:biopolymer transport protein ExbD